jgi:hypothetical protein
MSLAALGGGLQAASQSTDFYRFYVFTLSSLAFTLTSMDCQGSHLTWRLFCERNSNEYSYISGTSHSAS